MSYKRKTLREPLPLDKSSVLLIKELHPALRNDAFEFASSCWSDGIPLRIYSTRTTQAEQDFLYEFGRNRPGEMLTTSRGGSSLEEMGLMMHVHLYSVQNDGWISWDYSRRHSRSMYFDFWNQIVLRLEERGWLWMNEKPLPNPDKFQKTFGLSHGELSILKQLSTDDFIPIPHDQINLYESVHNRKSELFKHKSP